MTHDDQDFSPGTFTMSDGESPCSPSGVGFCPPPPPSATHDVSGTPLLYPGMVPTMPASLVRVPSGGLDVAREVEAMKARRNSPARAEGFRERFEKLVKSGEFWLGVGVASVVILLLVALGSGSSRSRSTVDY